jgi:hypothetical protein
METNIGVKMVVSARAAVFSHFVRPVSCVFGFLPVLVPFRAPRNWVVPVRASSFIGLSPQWYNVLKGSNLYLYLNRYWLREKLL